MPLLTDLTTKFSSDTTSLESGVTRSIKLFDQYGSLAVATGGKLEVLEQAADSAGAALDHVDAAQFTSAVKDITRALDSLRESLDINAAPKVDTEPARNELRRLDEKARESKGLVETITEGFGGLTQGFGAIGLAIDGFSRVTGLLGGVTDALTSGNAEMENYITSFGVLLKSEDAAKQRMAELAKFGAETPFELPEVAAASRMLQTFGGTILATGDNLRMIGDIASGVQQPFQDVAMWVGRTYDALQNGKPWGEAASRLQEMGAMSGAARTKLEEMQKSGASGAEIWAEFTRIMGSFDGMMAKQATTFSGMTSNLADDLGMLQRVATEPIFEVFKTHLAEVVHLLESPAVQQGVRQLAQGLGDGLNMVLPILGNVAGGVLQVASALQGPLTFALQNLIPIIATIAIASLPSLVGALGTLVIAAGTASTAVTGFTATLVGGAGLTEALAVLAGGGGLLASFAGLLAALVSPIGLVVVAVGALAIAWNQDFLGMRSTFEPWVQSVADGLSDIQNKLGHDLRAALGQSTEDWDKATGENTRRIAIGRADINTTLEGQRDDFTRTQAQINGAAQAAGETLVQTEIEKWRAAQQAQLQAMHQMNDEAAVLAMANADAVYDPLAKNVDRVAEAGWNTANAYLVSLVNGAMTGMPAVDAYIKDLLAKHDIAGLMGILGKNAAAAYITNMNMEIAAGLEKTAAAMEDTHSGAAMKLAAHAAELRKGAIAFGQEMGALPQTLNQYQKQVNDHAAKVAAAAAKHGAATKKMATDAKTDFVALANTIINSLGTAEQGVNDKTKNIQEVLVGLTGVIKPATESGMKDIAAKITGWLDAAAKGAAPSAQAIHDNVIGWLDRLAKNADPKIAVMAQAMRGHLDKLAEDSRIKAGQIAENLDAATLQAQVAAVKNLGDMATKAATPTTQFAELLTGMMDLVKSTGTAHMESFTSQAQALLAQMASATPPAASAISQALLGMLQNLATSGPPYIAALAQEWIGKLGEMQAAAQEKMDQARASVLSALDGINAATAEEGATLTSQFKALYDLMGQATEAGMADVAGKIRTWLQAAADGAAPPMQEVHNVIQQWLAQAAQSGDLQLRLLAQSAQAHFDEVEKAAAEKMAAAREHVEQEAQRMAQAQQGVVRSLDQSAAMMFEKGKSMTDVLVSLAPLAQQATAAGMPQVAQQIQQWMDAAASGANVSAQQIYESIRSWLAQAQQSGDASLALLAQQGMAHLNQLAAQASPALQQMNAAIEAQKTQLAADQQALQQWGEVVQAAQDRVGKLQSQIQDANNALNEFKNAQLEGEGASNEAIFQNRQQQVALQLQIARARQNLGAGVSSSPMIDQLNAQLDRLKNQGDVLRLQAQATFDPLHHALEQAASDQKEVTFQDAIAGIRNAKERVQELTPQLSSAQRHLAGVQEQQKEMQQAIQAANNAIHAQEQQVQQMTQALQQQSTALLGGTQQTQAFSTALQDASQNALEPMLGSFQSGLNQMWPAFAKVFGTEGQDTIYWKIFGHDPNSFMPKLGAQTQELFALYVGNGGPWVMGLVKLQENFQAKLDEMVEATRTDAVRIGRALDDGIIAGIEDGQSDVINAAIAMAQGAASAASDALGIHSPSRVFANMGKNVVDTFATTLRDGARQVNAAAAQMMGGAAAGASAGVAAFGGAGAVAGSGGGPLIGTLQLLIELPVGDPHQPQYWYPMADAVSIALERVRGTRES